MICENEKTAERFDYTFVENGNVKLENITNTFLIKYEDWVNDYFILDKWNSILPKNYINK